MVLLLWVVEQTIHLVTVGPSETGAFGFFAGLCVGSLLFGAAFGARDHSSGSEGRNTGRAGDPSKTLKSRDVFAAIVKNTETRPGHVYAVAERWLAAVFGEAKALASGSAAAYPAVTFAAADLVYSPYRSPVHFQTRIERLYEGLVQSEVVDWEQTGQENPKFRTRRQAEDWILQWSPFNLVDGSWLRGVVAQPGVLDSVTTRLLRIWSDEIGNGEQNQNHAHVWSGLLRQLGLDNPWIDATEEGLRRHIDNDLFLNDVRLNDSSFDNAALQLAVSLFPDSYFPETLGMNLWLEHFATPINLRLTSEMQRHGIDSTFFRLHAAIDNPSTGHGRIAMDAIHDYLDDFSTGIEQENAFERIWNGFVGFAISYDAVDVALKKKWVSGASKVRAQVRQVIMDKAKWAKTVHGAVRVDGLPLSSYFSGTAKDADALIDGLLKQGFLIPGEPERSPLLSHLIAFNGPMYNVFNRAELNLFSHFCDLLLPDDKWHKQKQKTRLVVVPKSASRTPLPVSNPDEVVHASLSDVENVVEDTLVGGRDQIMKRAEQILHSKCSRGQRAHLPSSTLAGRSVNDLLKEASTGNVGISKLVVDSLDRLKLAKAAQTCMAHVFTPLEAKIISYWAVLKMSEERDAIRRNSI